MLEPNDNPLVKPYQQGIYNQGLPVIVFGTDDIQRDYEKLKSKGVVFRSELTKTEWGTHADFEDTCGNLIQLLQA